MTLLCMLYSSGVGIMSLAEAEKENMTTLQSFTLGGHASPQEMTILCVLRYILVHSETYREAHTAP